MIRVEMPANNFEIEFIELTLHYIPPPRIEFEITAAASDDDRKLLISKQREEGLYPSQYQQRIAGSDADRDHRIDIRATVRDADGVRLPGKKVFLRIGDPPDSAPYAANFKKIGDNTGGAASLRDTELIADGTGEIHTVLTAPLASAGDNYWVQASTIPGFGISLGCDDKNDCFQSGVLTAWKRVYLEADRMFRVGADIAENTGAGSTRVRVTSRAGLNAGTRVLFVHAPDRFANDGVFYSEVHVIQQIHGRRRPTLVLDSPLLYSYYVETSAADAANDHLADAVGVISGVQNPVDRDLYNVNLDYVQPLFKTAFTDYVFLDCATIQTCDPIPYVPHYDSIPYASVYAGLAHKWAFTRVFDKELPNHQHLLIGSATPPENNSIILGKTSIDGFNTPPFSWVFDATIQSQAGGLSADYFTFLGESIAHELAHQWDVNPPINSTGGHCDRQSWDNGGECLMNGTPTSDRGNGHVAFHDYADDKSEYKRIRQQSDPLPQKSSLQ